DNLRVQPENTTPRAGAATPPDDEELLDILRTLDLADLARHWPHELPHGTRRLLGLARALACRPLTLLPDHPGAGLDAAQTRDPAARLRRIVDAGQTSILLVDHDMELIMSVCDELYVMNFGELVTHGPPTTVRTDPAVVDA